MRTFMRIVGAVCGAVVLGLIIGAGLVYFFGWDSDVLALKGAGWAIIAIAGGRIGVAVVDRWYDRVESATPGSALE